MRFLLVNNHCLTDPTAGVTHSLRTILRWLSDAGHECRALTTARFEAPVAFGIEEHLTSSGVDPTDVRGAADGDGVVELALGDVRVTLLLTRHNDERRVDLDEAAHYQALAQGLLHDFAPDVVIGCNAWPGVQATLAEARRQGRLTAFALRGYGYDSRAWFADVDHVFTCSRFLTDFYSDAIRLLSTPLEPPIDWSTVVAPAESRAFVTFVHPAPHKGLLLFARLAAMLAARRPDIPVLIVQSGRSAGALNGIPGIDFGNAPQIVAAPAVARPAEYFALTRLLLVPSVWAEPFGRVAAEAMINGIPPLVSDRGALPDVIPSLDGLAEGGRSLALPGWLTPESSRVPDADDVRHWFDAVVELWDDEDAYAALSDRAAAIALSRYSEAVSRRRHVEYFEGLTTQDSTVWLG